MGTASVHEGVRRMRFESLVGRQERGEITQIEAAEMLGVSVRTFQRWAGGSMRPGPMAWPIGVLAGLRRGGRRRRRWRGCWGSTAWAGPVRCRWHCGCGSDDSGMVSKGSRDGLWRAERAVGSAQRPPLTPSARAAEELPCRKGSRGTPKAAPSSTRHAEGAPARACFTDHGRPSFRPGPFRPQRSRQLTSYKSTTTSRASNIPGRDAGPRGRTSFTATCSEVMAPALAEQSSHLDVLRQWRAFVLE